MIDTKLEDEMEMAITLVELGRSARNEAKLRIDNRLGKCLQNLLYHLTIITLIL